MPTKNTQDSTAQTIVQAALESIESHGLEGLTVRKIAAKAKVNVAAINYHFRSKEQLLEKVLELALDNAFLDIDKQVSARQGKKLEAQLEAFLLELVNGFIEYPNVSRVVIHQLMFASQGQRLVIQRLERYLGTLSDRFARLRERKTDDLGARFQAVTSVSLLICMALMEDTFKASLGLDIRQPETRRKLVEYMMRAGL